MKRINKLYIILILALISLAIDLTLCLTWKETSLITLLTDMAITVIIAYVTDEIKYEKTKKQ